MESCRVFKGVLKALHIINPFCPEIYAQWTLNGNQQTLNSLLYFSRIPGFVSEKYRHQIGNTGTPGKQSLLYIELQKNSRAASAGI